MKSFGKDVMIYGASDLLFKAASFFAIAIYSHYLSLAQFGVMTLLTVSAGLLSSFVNLGVNNAVQRFFFHRDSNHRRQRLLVTTGLLQLVATCALVLGPTLAIAYVLREPALQKYGIEWTWAALALANILPEQVAQYTLDALRLHFSPTRFFFVSLVKNLLGLSVGLFLLTVLHMGVTAVLLGVLVGNAIAAPLGLWLIRRDLVREFDKTVARDILHFGYPFIFASAAYWIFGSMDRWMLMKLSTVEQVGLFSFAFRLAAVLNLVIGAFSQAWSPHVLRLTREDPEYRTLIGRIFPVWFFTLAVLGLCISLFAPEVLTLMSPEAYWAAAPLVGVAAFGIVLYGTTQITALGITLEGRTVLLSIGAWAAALTNVLLNTLLIPQLGAMGAAIATVLSYGVLTISFLVWTQQLHPIPLHAVELTYCVLVVAVGLVLPHVFGALGLDLLSGILKLLVIALTVLGAYGLGFTRGDWLRGTRTGPTVRLEG